jgi:Protein of unknown function (DUF3443)
MKDWGKFLSFATLLGLAFSVGCGGGSSSSSSTNTSTPPPNTIASAAANVAPITVNTGPADSGSLYANGAFVSVTVCVPGSSNCQTIGDVLVDTGSFGLRLVSSPVLTLSLPQETASDGNPMVECLQFLDSYTWGPVQTADIQISGEKASAVPIQVLSDTDYAVPGACSSPTGDTGSADTVETLGANGILGVGQLPQDCGVNATCPASANQYYSCASATATCSPIAATVAQQVQNPVSLFATDNNGVIIELPAVSVAEATVSGSLVFGIGTESNNGLGSATVYNADPQTLNFSTSFNGVNYSDAAFLDSGSNGYFFNDSSIATCPSSTDFYCPSSTLNLSATTQGFTAGSGTVEFNVANADTLFTDYPNDAAYNGLAGPAGTPAYFDWGLPFFYGRNVFTSIEGATAPGGTPPYWAY